MPDTTSDTQPDSTPIGQARRVTVEEREEQLTWMRQAVGDDRRFCVLLPDGSLVHVAAAGSVADAIRGHIPIAPTHHRLQDPPLGLWWDQTPGQPRNRLAELLGPQLGYSPPGGWKGRIVLSADPSHAHALGTLIDELCAKLHEPGLLLRLRNRQSGNTLSLHHHQGDPTYQLTLLRPGFAPVRTATDSFRAAADQIEQILHNWRVAALDAPTDHAGRDPYDAVYVDSEYARMAAIDTAGRHGLRYTTDDLTDAEITRTPADLSTWTAIPPHTPPDPDSPRGRFHSATAAATNAHGWNEQTLNEFRRFLYRSGVDSHSPSPAAIANTGLYADAYLALHEDQAFALAARADNGLTEALLGTNSTHSHNPPHPIAPDTPAPDEHHGPALPEGGPTPT
ncbi:hypothetical protein ACWDUL_21135 [Nocardia niigatensis]